MSDYDSDLKRFEICIKQLDELRSEYHELDFLSLLVEELELFKIWDQFKELYKIDFNELKAIANEKFNHKRHYEMRSPCTIPELIAIMLSLQDPFFQKI